jgi:phosphopantetheinyl transferase
MADVARRSFTANEYARWEAAPDDDRVEAFYRCWTRKESYIKAIGEGLSCPLDQFEVSFELGQPARLTSIEGSESLAASWFLADLPGIRGYSAAVAARLETPAGLCLEVKSLPGAKIAGNLSLDPTIVDTGARRARN